MPSLPSRQSAEPASQFRVLDMSIMGHKGGGCVEENQDRILHRSLTVGETDLLLLGVADGVSRCPHGAEVAEFLLDQHLAVDDLVEPFNRHLHLPLRRYLRHLNTRFYEEFAENPAMLDSASTLSLAVLENGVAYCGWVGDSPIYLARSLGSRFNNRFVVTQVSRPDLCGRLLIDCFGAHAPFRIKYRRVQMAPSDVLIVATDGAARSPESFGTMLNSHGPTPELLEAIQRLARRAEYFDDASLVMAQRLS